MQIICHLGWIFNRPLHAGSALVKRAEDRGLVFVEKMRSEQSQWTLAGDGRWGGRPSREAGVTGWWAAGSRPRRAATARSVWRLLPRQLSPDTRPSSPDTTPPSGARPTCRPRPASPDDAPLRPRGLGDSLATALAWMNLLLRSTYLMLCLLILRGRKKNNK